MQILAVDIGTGTQDILLFDSQRDVENCYKMVAPSPTVRVAEAVREATRRAEGILLTGVTMGGGPSAWAVRDHLAAGNRVFATPQAARTFNDDLDAVVRMGITLVSEDEARSERLNAVRIPMADFELDRIHQTFARLGVDIRDNLDGVAVAVFDHGNAPPGVSDRLFRFQYLEDRLRNQNSLSAFAYDSADIPTSMTRMQSVVSSLSQSDFVMPEDCPLMLMDTAPAAVLGALQDPAVAGGGPSLVVNIGNFHCLAFRLGQSGIEGMFEHHTGEIDAGQLEGFLDLLADGTITHEQVYETNGHGAFLFDTNPLPAASRFLVVTGPRRGLLSNSRLQPHFAAPFGDMILAGCYGLIRAFGDVYPESAEIIDTAFHSTGARSLW